MQAMFLHRAWATDRGGMELDGHMSLSPCSDAPEWRADGDVEEPRYRCQEDKSVTIGDETTGLVRFQVRGRQVDPRSDPLDCQMLGRRWCEGRPPPRSNGSGAGVPIHDRRHRAALLNSPLAGADLELRRDREAGRVADL